MAWVRFDDKLRSHPKWLQLTPHPEAKLLWFESMVACNEQTTDGLIAGYVLDQWAFSTGLRTPKKVKAATDVLVSVGLWHDHETIKVCDDCCDTDLAEGSFYVHQYLEYQPNADEVKDPLERRRGRRRKQLQRNTELCTQIRARDHDRCRYCGDEVNFKARSGDQSGTYDHINPNDFGSDTEGDKDNGNALHKVVVACRRCNGIKRDRTPHEAGMPLLPPPASYDVATGEVLAGSWPVPGPGQKPARTKPQIGQESPGPGQGRRPRAREAGPGQDGPGTGQGRARNRPGRAGAGRAGPGLVGLVRAEAGPGLDGTGLVGFGPGREPPPGGTTDPPPDRTRAAADDAEDLRSGPVSEPTLEGER